MSRLSPSQVRRYQARLLAFLKKATPESLAAVRGLSIGWPLMELARLHEQTLLLKVFPTCPTKQHVALNKQAGLFFLGAITPVKKAAASPNPVSLPLEKPLQTLSQRTVELAVSNAELRQEIAQRKAAEAIFKKSERHYAQLLKSSDRLQAESRRLSRQILLAQEEERREISRELHDVIAQTLTGINVRLATLKKEAALNSTGLDKNIALTQRLVEKSVNIVHRFARELRPVVLDELGLIPALHAYMKEFTARTGVRTQLTAFAGVEQLDTARRTVIFRVAQEALTNVARHAKATKVEVQIRKMSDYIGLTIKDDGKSFSVERAFHSKNGKRLGLLGMRERVEMFGGSFTVESAPGKGTTVKAQISPGKKKERKTTPSKVPLVAL